MNAHLTRGLLALTLSATLGVATAQQPAGLEPLPDIPPPPRMAPAQPGGAGLEPAVTIRQENGNRIEEFRVRGRVYAIRVTPPTGKPYLLVDRNGKGTMTKMDDIAGGTNPPQWTLFEF